MVSLRREQKKYRAAAEAELRSGCMESMGPKSGDKRGLKMWLRSDGWVGGRMLARRVADSGFSGKLEVFRCSCGHRLPTWRETRPLPAANPQPAFVDLHWVVLEFFCWRRPTTSNALINELDSTFYILILWSLQHTDSVCG
jgi:hypothetical protein